MTPSTIESPATLRRLVLLARDLLQAPDMQSVLDLSGKAIPELLQADGTLLLINAETQGYAAEFDAQGVMRPAAEGSILLHHARQAMVDQAALLLTDLDVVGASSVGAGDSPSGAISLLAFPFPQVKPMGVLAAFWRRCRRRYELAREGATLRHLGELTCAALGNVAFRQSLLEQVSSQSQEIAAAARLHANEMLRRDSVEQEIERISVTDVMTGMLNRRGFFLHAELGFKVARRQGVPATLIFVDIDGLKDVNDKYGHDAGDHLIEDAARILQKSFRESDVVARLGGDEFAVFTIDPAQPQLLQERIRHNIDSYAPQQVSPCPISFSIGIVKCDPASDLSLADYLVLADQQMYQQKKQHCK